MITSEEIIKNLVRETGITRPPECTGHVLSKPEMESLLIFIIDLKNKYAIAKEKKEDTREIIKDVLTELEIKDAPKELENKG